MTKEGTLSIIKRENSYQIRFSSNNPYDQDGQPRECHDEENVGALLQQLGMETESINQVGTELRKSGVVVLYIILSLGQIQAFFRSAA